MVRSTTISTTISDNSTNLLGEVNDDINFVYEANTEVTEGCAASLNDEMWILGGNALHRQVISQKRL